MAKPADEGSGASTGVTPAYASDHRSYLLTLHYAKGVDDVGFVTVQSSHQSEAHRFADLSSAIDFLRSIAIEDRPSSRL